MTDEVRIDGKRVMLVSRGKVLDAERGDWLERVYDVSAGSDLFGTDVEFHVFRFRDKLWVLPEKTCGVSATITTLWPEERERADRSWDAVIPEMPRAWRRSYLWGLMRPHVPALLVLPLSTLPKWQVKRVFSRNHSHYVFDHEYPFLDALNGGYFHQDWDIAGDTLEAVIGAYRKEADPAIWAETRADIAALLARHGDETLPREFFRLFQPDVDAESWGPGTRRWLQRIDALLQ